MTMKTLRDLGPGDEVAIMERSYRGGAKLIAIVPVTRVTATQILTGSSRWRRDRGGPIPEPRYGSGRYITPATDALRHAEEHAALRSEIVGVVGRHLDGMVRLRIDTLRTIAAALRADPATEGA